MKNILIAFLLTTSIITAQDKEYKHSLKGITKIKINSKSTVKIISSETSNLIFSRLTDDKKLENPNSNKENKRKGLTPIYSAGKDNTNDLGYSVTKDGTTLIVTDLKSSFQSNETTFKIPKKINITVDSKSFSDVYIDGFSSEIEVETSAGKIDLKNVTGPVTLHSSIGDINVDFSNINQASPITITSNGSEIDVTLPAKTKASLDMKTNGTVYTNFNLQAQEKANLKNSNPNNITGNINEGGVKIKIKSSLGNIYLRKK